MSDAREEWQRCPVCGGRRTVSHGFFSGMTMATSTETEKCLVCNGTGMVPYPDYGQSDVGERGLADRLADLVRRTWPAYHAWMQHLPNHSICDEGNCPEIRRALAARGSSVRTQEGESDG